MDETNAKTKGNILRARITEQHKITRRLRHKLHGHSYRKRQTMGKSGLVCKNVTCKILPKSLEKQRRDKRGKKATLPENPMVININSIFNCSKFHLSELMSKPIKYPEVHSG